MINRYPLQIQDAVIDAASDAVRDTWDGAYLARLGIVSHFRNNPRQDGTLLSVIGNEERPLQDGRCYVLDGVDDLVSITASSDFVFGTGDYKVSLYTKVGSAGGTAYNHFFTVQNQNNFSLKYFDTSNNLYLYNGSTLVSATIDLEDTFHLISVERVGTAVSLSVDGVIVGTGTDSKNYTINDTAYIGFGNTGEYLEGSILDVKVEKAGTLVAHYKCDEQSGTTAYDSSGNGNHGTITYATLSSFHGTQSEKSFQNQVGYSRAFTTDDTLIVAGQTLTDISFDIDLMGETGDLSLFSDSASINLFVIASGGAGGVGNISGTPTFTVDGASFSGTRGELYTLLAVAGPHTATITLSNTLDLYFGGFNSASWGVDGQVITNLVVNGVAYDGPTYIPRDESTPSQDVLGNALQHTGQAKLIAKARENNCGTFDGSNDLVDAGDIGLTTTGTISLWIKTAWTGGYDNIFDTAASGNTGIRLETDGNFLKVYYANTSGGLNYSDAAFNQAESVGQWVHIAVTWSGTNIKGYTNGVESFSASDLLTTFVRNALTFGVGFSVSRYFEGSLFSARVYDTALSVAQITTVFGHGDINGLILHYPFSEGAGTVIHDVSPNGNHGTATNITQSSFWGTTQDEYATNFVDGYTPYFTEDDTLIVAGQTLTSISFDIDLMGETGDFVLLSDSLSGSKYLMAIQSGSGSQTLHAGFGTVVLSVDGVTFSGTRAELYTLLAVTGHHDMVLSLSAAEDLYYGGYPSSGFEIDGQVISNVKVNGIAYDGPTRVPAKLSTLDAYDNALTNPASPTHNGFEGVIDYREIGLLDATPPALDHIYTGAAELDGVSGSYVSVPDAANLNGLTDFVMEARDVYIADWSTGNDIFFAKFGAGGNAFIFRRIASSIKLYGIYGGVGTDTSFTHGLTGAATASVRLTRSGTSVTAELDTGSGYAAIGTAQTVPADTIDTTTSPLEVGSRNSGTVDVLTGKIGSVKLTSSGTTVLDIDFRKFNHKLRADYATSGQLVTLNGGVTFPKVIVPDALAYDDTYPKDYCEFDGVSGSYVSVPALTAFGTGNFSVSAKVTFSNIAVSNVIHGGGTNSFGLRAGDGNALKVFKNGIVGSAVSSGSLINGVEYVVGYTRAGTTGTYYIDGVASGVITDANDYSVGQSEIGAAATGTTSPFTGIKKWARVYGSALSASEMASDATGVIQTTSVLDIDFSTANARNGLAETGQILTYNGGAGIPRSTLANPMFQRDDSWTRLFEVGLTDSDAAKQS